MCNLDIPEGAEGSNGVRRSLWNTGRDQPNWVYMAFFSMNCRNYRQRMPRPGFLLVLSGLLSALPLPARPPSLHQVPTPGQEVPRAELFHHVITNQEEGETNLDQFERVQRVESRKTAGDRDPAEVKVWRIFPTGTGVDRIPLSPDGKLPAPQTYLSNLEKLEKYLVWVIQEGAAQKEAYAKADRRRKDRFDLIDATQQAFIFTPEGTETRASRTLLRYSMVPNPEYRPTSRLTTLFPKVRGTVWIDQQTSQLAKIEGVITGDVSLALFLAKVYKGSHFMQERYEVAPGIWEPTFEQYDFDGRKYLIPFSIHERTFYSSYKRVGLPKEALGVVRAELGKVHAEAGTP